MLDAVTHPAVQTTVIMSSAQIGKTTLMKAIIGYHIDQDPSPILLVNPTSHGRDLLQGSPGPDAQGHPGPAGPDCRSQVPGYREHPALQALPWGAPDHDRRQCPSSLAARPIRVVLCDEVDRYPPSAGTEGDPVTACMLAKFLTEPEPSTPEASAASLPPRLLQLLPAGATVAGQDSHLLKDSAFSRRTKKQV